MSVLVITLVLDEATTVRFGRERSALFPAGRTRVGAHLTLFHAVPADTSTQERAVVADVAAEAERATAFDVAVTGVMSLGRGAAYRVESETLDVLHERLQQRWWDGLTRQDRQPLRAHVTVQNKVEPRVAKETVARLRAGFVPVTARAEGLAVWRYLDGGGWEPLERLRFV